MDQPHLHGGHGGRDIVGETVGFGHLGCEEDVEGGVLPLGSPVIAVRRGEEVRLLAAVFHKSACCISRRINSNLTDWALALPLATKVVRIFGSIHARPIAQNFEASSRHARFD